MPTPANSLARPPYTARRREALLIWNNGDGLLEVGRGRVRIARGTVPYYRRVVAAMGRLLDLPGGVEALEHGDALGHQVTLVQPEVPTVPANAWVLPDDILAATSAGMSTGVPDTGNQVLTGTGEGCASRIVFDPDDWPRPDDPASTLSHEVLLKLLLEANACAEGASSPPPAPVPAGARQDQLRLSCRPSKVGDTLSFPYVVDNPSPDDVFVMDAVARAEGRAVVVINSSGDALVGPFVPPMPADRRIVMPVLPLARLLPAGRSLERHLKIPAPYAESSPWLPDPLPGEQVVTDIRSVVLAVGYWPAGTKDVTATKHVDASDLYTITTPHTGGALVSLRFPTNGLRFARRAQTAPKPWQTTEFRPPSAPD